MIYVSYILFGMLVLRFLVALANFLSRPWLAKKLPIETALVSVLIPARNEENSLPLLLGDLAATSYPAIEIIVCNDQSDDGTEQVLEHASHKMSNLSYFNNQTLPEGWIGKNHACFQLANRAKGRYFLFLDADVRLSSNAISHAVAFVQKRNRALLSVFPQQKIESTGEWETVPVMNWILLTFLPVILVQWRWFSSLSAANGQFMFFDGDNYRQNQWHSQFRSNHVEDIRIAKAMKKQKFRIALLLGNNDVFCRMYTTYNEAIAGFARNMHQYFGGNRFWMTFFVLVAWCRLPFFLVNGHFMLFSVSFIMLLLMKAMVSVISRQSVRRNFYEHGSQLVAIFRIMMRNWQQYHQKNVEWKGRKYMLKQ